MDNKDNCFGFGCFFCEKNINPNYKEPYVLKRFLNAKGEVQTIRKTECCFKHQKRLCEETQKAKKLAILPM